MWGSSQAFVISEANGNFSTSRQLANVDYHRPDSWHFNFVARVSSNVLSGGPLPFGLTVTFSLRWGVGRSNSEIQTFAYMYFTSGEFSGAGSSNGAYRICDRINSNPLNANLASPPPNVFEVITAQSIQCNAECLYLGAPPAAPTQIFVEMAAYFSPRTHVRPDWSNGDYHSELNGR